MNRNLNIGPYILKKSLSSSTRGQIFKARKEGDNTDYVIKILDKNLNELRVKNEITAMNAIKHKNILAAIEIIENESQFCIVMPKCRRDLHTYVIRSSVLTENKVRQFMIQIIDGLSAIHEAGWCHRDMKLENIFCVPNERFLQVPAIVIADFGFASPHSLTTLQTDHVGSIQYCAPEIVQFLPYDGVKADIWTLGVIMYGLLTAGYPFTGKTNEEIVAKITSAKYEPCRFLSRRAEEVLQKLLVVDPDKRITLSELKKEPWLRYAEYHAMLQEKTEKMKEKADDSTAELSKSFFSMIFGQNGNARSRDRRHTIF